MPGRDIIVIGASAGGIQTLLELVQKLPANLDASLFIVVHTSPSSPGVLPTLLNRAGPLPVTFAANGDRPEHRHIYVARPDYHLLFQNELIRVAHGPKENGFRPAVDPLFRTAARNFGPRVVGIVLSGGLDDGTDGLRIIKECGGIAIAQNPEEADFPSMPASAIRNVPVDHIARLAEIPALLRRYSRQQPKEVHMCAGGDRPDIVDHGDHGLQQHDVPGKPSNLTCPECGGALWQQTNGHQLRFRCHVGHVYTGEGLAADTDRHLEQSLWAAVRVMEEAAELRRRMAAIAEGARWKPFAPDYHQQANDLEQRAGVIRALLNQNGQRIQDKKPRPPSAPKPRKKKPRP